MPITFILLGLASLVGASLYIVKQGKRYRIRHTGTLVMAKVIQVQSWRDSSRADISLEMKMVPFLGAKWWYELSAEWTDPDTRNILVITSGIKKGLPRYQRGDHIPLYVSPYGNYLELS